MAAAVFWMRSHDAKAERNGSGVQLRRLQVLQLQGRCSGRLQIPQWPRGTGPLPHRDPGHLGLGEQEGITDMIRWRSTRPRPRDATAALVRAPVNQGISNDGTTESRR